MLVNRRAFDATLAASLAEGPQGSVPGTRSLFGPGSASWQIGREAALFLGGGAAALLQLAHPYVAHGVDQHSDTRHDPLGRFERTFQHVYAMTFGDAAEAARSARRVRAIHDGIHGTIPEAVGRFPAGHRYRAHDHDALLWVHATLVKMALDVYDLVVEPLSLAERDAYYQESKRFAGLFGIDRARMPTDWDAFEAYFDAMIASDEIRVGAAASEMSRFLLTPPTSLTVPIFGWYQTLTAGLLPPTLRAQYGLRYGRREERLYALSVAALSRSVRRLPPRLRFVPAYHEARRRLRGLPARDHVGRAIEAGVLRVMLPPKAGDKNADKNGDARVS